MSGKSLIFGPSDRDAQGRIAAERSLVDMLPAAEPTAPSASAAPGARVKTAQLAALAFVGVAVLIALFALVRPTASAPALHAAPTAAQPAAPTAAPAAAPASRAPSATAVPSGCIVTQTTATFYAPAGSPAPIAAERGASCHLVAWHALYPDWRQITIGGGAPVWVPLATLSEASTAGLPDLAPPPTATPAPATARPVVIIEQAPAPTPEPTRCATVRGGGATVQRCGAAPLDQLQADAERAWREQMTPATPTPRR